MKVNGNTYKDYNGLEDDGTARSSGTIIQRYWLDVVLRIRQGRTAKDTVGEFGKERPACPRRIRRMGAGISPSSRKQESIRFFLLVAWLSHVSISNNVVRAGSSNGRRSIGSMAWRGGEIKGGCWPRNFGIRSMREGL
jgi:hypothetical protein